TPWRMACSSPGLDSAGISRRTSPVPCSVASSRNRWWGRGDMTAARSGGLALGLLGGHDPGVGLVEQLGQRQQVVAVEAVAFLPVIALLVGAAWGHAVPRPLVDVVLPFRQGEGAVPSLLVGLCFLGRDV